MQRVIVGSVSAGALAIALTLGVGAQSLGPATVADFGQWEALITQPRGGLSPDGRWVAYVINRSNRNNELRIANIADGTTTVAAFGLQPQFSANSHWAAYAIGLAESEEEKLRKQRKPIHRKVGLLKLGAGDPTVVEGIESFAFDASGKFIAMKRYAPERPGARPDAPEPPPAEDTPPIGTTIIVRELATGRDASFGNVAEFSWQEKGRLLALAISAEDRAGNGIQIHDPESGALRVLDSSSASTYSGLTWRKDADDLAVLRSRTDEGRDGPTQVALAWKNVGSSSFRSYTYDHAADRTFPAGMRAVSFRRPSWSDDGAIVFFGIARWDEKTPAKAGAALGAPTPADAKPPAGDRPAASVADDPEEAGVDVWHARDADVMPRQRLSARTDRQRNMPAAWHLEGGKFVQLGRDSLEQVTPIKRQQLAYAATWGQYAMDRSIGRPAADLYLIDLSTGERTKVKERIDDRYLQASPGGRYLLYLQADHYWTVDTSTRAITNITKSAATSFIDRESDQTVRQKPPFGVAGWAKDDSSVILNDKFDVWQVAADGSRAARLTDGTAEQIRHRVVRLNPDDEWIDTSKPLHVSLFAPWTKRSGYARVDPASSRTERLIWLDKSIGAIAKAKEADTFVYVAQSFDDSPDIFVAGADLKDAKQVTATNAFHGKYAWGRSELVEYKSDRGERLQGALFYPAGYEPGKKYPMVVYMYERLSDGLHRYSSPSDRDPYNASVFTSQGYLFLQPDIIFRPREPGVSVVECVGPAVRKVIGMGIADPKRVGIIGHSWGGFDTVYLSAHTDLFAAGIAGAPITNLVSNYGNHHWSSGIAETDHIETGQQRMEVPLWEDLQAYIRNSAVYGVATMKTPLMVAFGDNDGTVHWHQGVELYNIARRAKKDVVMLVYAGEDHGLRKKPNQVDYQHRILQWFGHYLKNEPPRPWITSGVSFLEREQELKRLKTKKGT